MNSVRIDFTRSGWRQFSKLNRGLGARFIKGFILRHELSDYIAAHEERGVHLDTVCQEIRYDDGIYLLMMRCHGVWYITDIYSTEVPSDFRPLFFWKQIKRGYHTLLAHVLIGWQNTTKKWESEAVSQ